MTKTDLHTNYEHDDCLFGQEHLEEAAMRTLEPEHQQRMERHLARCSMCREELAHIEQSLQQLAFSVDQIEPPANAKQGVMARLKEDRGGNETTRSAPTAPAAAKPKPPARPVWKMPWSYGGLFAGLAVALLVVGLINFLPINESNGDLPRGQIEVMAMENTCPDCDESTGGQIGADPQENDGLVMAWNLDPQRKHEVWCVNRDGHHTKVGDLQVGDSGSVMQTVSFPDAVGGYQQIYVIRDDGAQELTVIPGNNRNSAPNSDANPSPPTE